MNDGPQAGGRGEQLGLFHSDGRPAVPPPTGNLTATRLYSFENLWRAYRECRRTKRGTLNALAFEIDAEAGLLELQNDLLTHRYRPGTSICFVTERLSIACSLSSPPTGAANRCETTKQSSS